MLDGLGDTIVHHLSPSNENQTANVRAYLPPVWQFSIRSPRPKIGFIPQLTSAVGGQSTAGVSLLGGNSESPVLFFGCCKRIKMDQ